MTGIDASLLDMESLLNLKYEFERGDSPTVRCVDRFNRLNRDVTPARRGV
ncbi:MAG: hypothetical protein JSV80_08070 [Acidobacteriota bacterium]|nr:MAG: hypothetical protein JSV80_08070 [Acidobacteriota bacterium]